MAISIPLEHTYADELEGLYLECRGASAPAPALVTLNESLAIELGLDPEQLRTPAGAALLAGSELPEGAKPIAQAYAGHQFGGFTPQLGDGRALLVGELIDVHGVRRDLHLKGSGRTPFSRGGDGKATLSAMLREHLFGEFMHAMHIPTTRALSVVTTGEQIQRSGLEAGAVLARIASSHLRVGTFALFASRGDTEKLRRLADYAIRRHDPELIALKQEERALGLLRAVVARQAALIARWVAVGFVHGVMNTDNVTLSGETIDYGPCAFLDHYDPAAVFSSIDRQGRYAYLNQPRIALWNMARFAETLLELIDPDDTERAIGLATHEIEQLMPLYQQGWLEAYRAKLGLSALGAASDDEEDTALIAELLGAIEGQRVDYTRLFRELAKVARGDDERAAAALAADPQSLLAWQSRWLERLDREPRSRQEVAQGMDRVNPIYIPRNHMVERALDDAAAGDMQRFEQLLALLKAPHTHVDGVDEYANPAPPDAPPHVTFCGT